MYIITTIIFFITAEKLGPNVLGEHARLSAAMRFVVSTLGMTKTQYQMLALGDPASLMVRFHMVVFAP